MRVLALDPSTDITGVAVGDFSLMRLTLLSVHRLPPPPKDAKEGDALTQRFLRIAHHEEALRNLVLHNTSSLDGLAYEMHTGRNGVTSNALSQAAGAYLSAIISPGMKVWEISPLTAKAAWGGTKLKSADGKVAVVKWAKGVYGDALASRGIALSDDDDAIADAIAVLLAAWKKWRAEEAAKEQLSLIGPRGGKF